MAIPDLIVDRIATPGVMAAKLLLPWGSATDGVGQRGAHQLLAAPSAVAADRSTIVSWRIWWKGEAPACAVTPMKTGC